ncbi:helix-turn-helix transcriptional regulator [Planktotalea lamellibrachiae]|nr:helix-turn-helix transcriptional regulator [Aliiroseovarius lamellibrachiae]
MTQSAETLVWAKKIGASIRTKRKLLGLNLEDLSRLSGSTVPTLSHIERGTRDVKLSTLISLAGALRTDLAELIVGNRDQQSPQPSSADGGDGYDLGDD